MSIVPRGFINRLITRGYGAIVDLTNVGTISVTKKASGLVSTIKAGIDMTSIFTEDKVSSLISTTKSFYIATETARAVDSLISISNKMSTIISSEIKVTSIVNTGIKISSILLSTKTIDSSLLTSNKIHATIDTSKRTEMVFKSVRLT